MILLEHCIIGNILYKVQARQCQPEHLIP